VWLFGFLRALTLSLPNPFYPVVAQNETSAGRYCLLSAFWRNRLALLTAHCEHKAVVAFGGIHQRSSLPTTSQMSPNAFPSSSLFSFLLSSVQDHRHSPCHSDHPLDIPCECEANAKFLSKSLLKIPLCSNANTY